MNARRLLILCYFYPPLGGGGVHRVLSFTRHLPALGWDCSVVCAGEEDYWVKDDTLIQQVPAATEVLRVKGGGPWDRLRARGGSGRRSGAAFGRLRRWSDFWLLPDAYVGWARRARRAVTERLARGDVDVLLSSSPPDSVHLAARDAARQGRSRVPWVADFRDPWVGLHFRRPPTAWHARRQAALERSVLQQADRVLAASRTHAADLRAALGAAGDRVEHLPNGFEPAAAGPGATPDRERFLIAFTGTLAQMPDAEILLEAVHDVLARRPEARRRLRVQLAGAYESGYEDRAIALGLKGIVEFLGPRPHGETRDLQRRADLLAFWKPRGAGYRTMVPGKLYEYLESQRPIVALLDPEDEAAVLARQGGAAVLTPGRREPLVAEIDRRYQVWREGGRVDDVPRAELAEHTRGRLAARLADILERARAERP